MRKRYLTGALVLLLVGLSGVAFAGNKSTVTQTGPGNEAAITQTGDLNVAHVTQANLGTDIGARAVVFQDNSASLATGNTATIVQPDASNPDPAVIGAYIEQVGGGNVANQELDYWSQASIRQFGDNNSAEQYHTGLDNWAFAEQDGISNSLTQTQDGDGNYAEAFQYGTNNSITQTQDGSDNYAYAWQDGDGNSLIHTQIGDGHWGHVTQEGYGNVAVVTQQVTQMSWPEEGQWVVTFGTAPAIIVTLPAVLILPWLTRRVSG